MKAKLKFEFDLPEEQNEREKRKMANVDLETWDRVCSTIRLLDRENKELKSKIKRVCFCAYEQTNDEFYFQLIEEIEKSA